MNSKPACRRGIVIAITLCLALFSGKAAQAQETTNSTLVLPKSPAAAAYVLGRLSNQELISAPRGEFVYAALLQRRGLERKYRVEAIEGLAKIHNSDSLTELLKNLALLDKKGTNYESVIRDISPILFQTKTESLTAQREALLNLAQSAQLSISRQIAFAGIITADKSGDAIWTATASNPEQLSDLILSIDLIRDVAVRAGFYSKLEPLLQVPDTNGVQLAAIATIPSIPGHEEQTFQTLSALLLAGTERDAAVAAIQKIPNKFWSVSKAQGLTESLVSYLQNVPVEKRSSTDTIRAFQLAMDLAKMLPADQAASFIKTLHSLGVTVFEVRTVKEQMLYDKSLLVAEAGKPLTIVLINVDSMPHNLVVVAPGTAEEVGTAAEKMQPIPDAQGRLYIPDSKSVLKATALVDPGQEGRLSFNAPKKTGDYQFVCTFPGHWRRMVGTLAVVTNVEEYIASHSAVVPPKSTEWNMTNFSGELAMVDAGRDLHRGMDIFNKLTCITCHKIGPAGADYGPELTDVFHRYHDNALEVLQQILDPSLVIADRYRVYDLELKDGDELSGMIVKEDAETMTLQTGPTSNLIRTLKKVDIKQQTRRPTSLMPAGLLNSLSKEEIFDLLAFLKSGGGPGGHEHHHE